MTASTTFSNSTFGALTFTNITVSEDDVGTVNSFVGSTGTVMRVGNQPISRSTDYQGLGWSGFGAGALAPGSSTTVTFNYDVTEIPSAGQGINGLQQAFTVDTQIGAGLTLTAVEYVYDTAGHLVGQSTITLATPSATAPVAAGDFNLSAAFSALHVEVVVTAAVAANATAPSAVNFSVIDQGFHQTTLANQAALGDYVWEDANNNGVQDAGESGIAGVTVDLLDASGHFTGLTTTTDSTGYYHFDNLNAGVYEVKFETPAGYNLSPTGAGTPATDSNPNQSSGVTGPVTLVAGQTDNTIDAGMYRPAALGDYVFVDVNGNGVQDAGDTGVSGVTVNLLDASGNFTGQTTTTDSTGYYHFTGLTPGVYEVQFVPPVDYTFSPTGAGTPATDSNPNPSTGVTGPITLVSGQTDNTIDAGLIAPAGSHDSGTAALGDYVWEDANDNGVQNAGETGIANVTVNLLDSTGSFISSTTTNSVGYYQFANLMGGQYEVQFLAPTGYAFSPTGAGTPATDSNPNPNTGVTSVITLAAGTTDETIDAGLYRPAALGDYVFLDCNANGIQDAGDTGVAGVTVNLLNATGGFTGTTTTTDSTGHYHFTGLAPGVYEVQFIAPAGDSFSLALQGGNPALDSNANQATGVTGPITLVSGQTDNTIDAGIVVPKPATAALGDYVFLDCNKNGIQDSGESGVAGVTVKLLNGTGSSVLATTTTDSSGHYLFSNLTAGSYEVQFVIPTGYALTKALQGSNTALDSNPNQSTGITAPVTLSAGQTNLTIDAGIYKTSSGSGGGCGGWTYNGGGGCSGGTSGGWGGSCWGGGYGGGYYGGGGDNCSYGGGYGGGSYGGSGWCGGYSGGGYGGGSYGGYGNCGSYGGSGGSGWYGGYGSGTYCGGGTWGSGGWNGCGWTNGWDDYNAGPGELHSVCGTAQNVQFTYHHSDCVSSDALACGVGNSWGHNGQSSCFIQITTSQGDHSWGAKVLCQGSVSDGDTLQTDLNYDLASCGGQLYAHVYASQADCLNGRSAIQEISFNCGTARDTYLGQQVGSLCLTGYDGTHGSVSTNW